MQRRVRASPSSEAGTQCSSAANAPIDFDQSPYITHGLGPNGEKIVDYNFDVLAAAPAPTYVFFTEGSSTELTAQPHIVDVVASHGRKRLT